MLNRLPSLLNPPRPVTADEALHLTCLAIKRLYGDDPEAILEIGRAALRLRRRSPRPRRDAW